MGSFAGRDGREMGERIMAVWVGWVAGVGSQREFWGLRADTAGTPWGLRRDSAGIPWGLRVVFAGTPWGLRGTPGDSAGTP